MVARARDGDQDAWDERVERYLPLVCGMVARSGVGGADADDVNQTVWLRLVEHLGEIREPQALPGWIVTTTRRECLRVLRKQSRLVPVDPQVGTSLEPDPVDPGLDGGLLDDERRQALRDGLAELPADRRALLLLLIEDPPVPYREVSTRLGIPMGSIGPTRVRALAQLRTSAAFRAFLARTDERKR
jgi:RNA polymerase sigma factor (sigma-70 family)